MLISSLFLASLTVVIQVRGQSTDVTTCVLDYQWAINHRNQTPCLVAAYLEGACSGRSNSVNRTPAGTHYIGPTLDQADSCQCSSIVYSLVEACGGCQGQTQFINYTQWTNNCDQTQIPPIGQFPTTFPSTVEVPSWAKLDISKTGNTFDPVAAAREAAISALPPIPSLVTTSSTQAPISGTQSQLNPSTTASSPALNASSSDSGGLSPGAIAGITIGVLIIVVGVLLAIFWRMLQARKRRNAMRGSALAAVTPSFNEKPMPLSPSPPSHIHTRSLSDPASIVTPFIYNTTGASPRPDSAAPSSTYYTTGPLRSSVDDMMASPQTATSPRTIMTVQRSNTPQAVGPPGYTGAPEV